MKTTDVERALAAGAVPLEVTQICCPRCRPSRLARWTDRVFRCSACGGAPAASELGTLAVEAIEEQLSRLPRIARAVAIEMISRAGDVAMMDSVLDERDAAVGRAERAEAEVERLRDLYDAEVCATREALDDDAREIKRLRRIKGVMCEHHGMPDGCGMVEAEGRALLAERARRGTAGPRIPVQRRLDRRYSYRRLPRGRHLQVPDPRGHRPRPGRAARGRGRMGYRRVIPAAVDSTVARSSIRTKSSATTIERRWYRDGVRQTSGEHARRAGDRQVQLRSR